MTTPAHSDFSPLSLSQDRPVPLHIVVRNITYSGEVMWASRWQASLGNGRSPEAAFRIVLLDAGTTQPEAGDIVDLNTVVCVPAPSQALREPVAPYTARPWADVRAPSLESLARGTVVRPRGPRWNGSRFFTGRGWGDALASVAALLLDTATERPERDTLAFPHPLTVEDVALLWRGLVQGERAARVAEGVRAFAPGLGLVDPARPEQPALAGALRDDIRAALRGRTHPVQRVTDTLLRRHGLPPYAGFLATALFIREGQGGYVLGIGEGNSVPWQHGGVFPGRLLTAHLLPGVAWSLALLRAGNDMLPEPPVDWSSLAPYLALLFPGADLAPNRGRSLLTGLETTVRDLRASYTDALQGLGNVRSASLPDLLDRLAACGRARDPASLKAEVELAYRSVRDFHEDVRMLHGLEVVSASAADLAAFHAYLRKSVFGPGLEGLDVERLALLQQINLDDLARAPALLDSIREQMRLFRARYAAVYRAQHAAHRAEAERLHGLLEDFGPRVQALERLNGISGLGGPVRESALRAYPRLLDATAPCTVEDSSRIPLDTDPVCPGCGFTLSTTPLTSHVQALEQGIQSALQEQCRRLSSQAIRQILARSHEDRVVRFLQVIEASDLSFLAEFLDEDLAQFIRQFLQTEAVREAGSSIYQSLALRFPTVAEEDVDVVAAEFAALLREALSFARRDRPDEAVRVRLT